MTFRPPPFNRWVSAVVLVALGAFFLFADVEMTITQGFDWLGSSTLVIGALLSIGVGVLMWGMSIEVTDSTVSIGTFLLRRTFVRGEIVKVSVGGQRTAYFIGRDGRVAFSIAGFIWGDKVLAAIAGYLGVPVKR